MRTRYRKERKRQERKTEMSEKTYGFIQKLSGQKHIEERESTYYIKHFNQSNRNAYKIV